MQLDFLQEEAQVTAKENPPKKAKRPQKRFPVIEKAAEPLPPLPESLRHPFVPDANAKEEADIEKAPGAFKTISETAKFLDVPQHVLRFWESRFSQIKPLKLNGGRRYYRPQDISILTTIKHLLYKQGYTIKGAKKAFNAEKSGISAGLAIESVAPAADLGHLEQLIAVRQELMDLREYLRRCIQKQPA